MGSWTARLLDLVTTGARQALPLNGILGGTWRPVTAIAVYWLESLVLVLTTALLCWLMQRRTWARDVLLVHVPSLAIFGVFIGVMLNLLIQNGHTPSFDLDEFRSAASAMLIVLGVSGAIDLAMWRSMDVSTVAGRVESCLGRWALLWILSFFGVMVPLFTGRPVLFLTTFAVLKTLWEGGAMLGRVFGARRDPERAGW